jgi:hypothetical protein
MSCISPSTRAIALKYQYHREMALNEQDRMDVQTKLCILHLGVVNGEKPAKCGCRTVKK